MRLQCYFLAELQVGKAAESQEVYLNSGSIHSDRIYKINADMTLYVISMYFHERRQLQEFAPLGVTKRYQLLTNCTWPRYSLTAPCKTTAVSFSKKKLVPNCALQSPMIKIQDKHTRRKQCFRTCVVGRRIRVANVISFALLNERHQFARI